MNAAIRFTRGRGTLVRNLPPNPPPCDAACKGPGTAVVAVPCDDADATQKGWAYDAGSSEITHGGLCVSAQAWGIPLNLYGCGNKTTTQTFSFDTKDGHFNTNAPANKPTPKYPCALTTGTSAFEAKASVTANRPPSHLLSFRPILQCPLADTPDLVSCMPAVWRVYLCLTPRPSSGLKVRVSACFQ